MAETTTLGALLAAARVRLTDAGVAEAGAESRLIVEHYSGTERIDAIRQPERPVAAELAGAVEAALTRRLAGEPVHRILGYREFYGLRLLLSSETLEPRSDTEVLVDLVLPFLRERGLRNGGCRVLDLGTGTGAIALALLHEVPQATALGADISSDAVATACRNADMNGLGRRFEARVSDWFSALPRDFDLIVANPPYIESRMIASLQAEVRNFDPSRALDGGEDGLDAYRIIAAQARGYLERDGRVAVEIGWDQKDKVVGLFASQGWQLVDAAGDLGGNDRALMFSRQGSG